MMIRRIAATVLTLIVCAAILSGGASLPGASAQLPGITTADRFAKGCVDCHGVVKEGGDRLDAIVKAIPKHPALGTVKNVPDDCMRCHKAAVKSIAFADSVHKSHYGSAAKSLFVQHFQGQCLHCHTFQSKSGKMSFKSGPKNW